jgi:glycosyltransferase involved in cell wall biosynthesis
LAPSDFVRNWYVGQGVSAERIETVPLGLKAFPASIREPEPSTFRFLYLGGIAPIKGVHVALEAFRQLSEPDCEMWIVGDDSAEQAYVQTLEHYAHSRVRWLGRRTREQVGEILSQCHVLLVPSLWHETFCFTAREALSVGKPVIASDVGALRDVVIHKENGLLVEPGNVEAWRASMQQMLRDPTWLRGAVEPAETLTEIEHARRIEQAYSKLKSPIL